VTRRVPFLFAAALLIFSIAAGAQTVRWTTNFYSVSGASFREIRDSISRSRPWKDGFDGDTRWRVEWRFNTLQTSSGCVCTSFSTTTTITTTLPRWSPSANILPQTKEQWTRYFTNLAQHEAGHARLGLAAAKEIQKSIADITAQPDCARLQITINEQADKIVADYREREKEYDRRTVHGTKVGER
jgi:predicted secreted Zn-dependent protease